MTLFWSKNREKGGKKGARIRCVLNNIKHLEGSSLRSIGLICSFGEFLLLLKPSISRAPKCPILKAFRLFYDLLPAVTQGPQKFPCFTKKGAKRGLAVSSLVKLESLTNEFRLPLLTKNITSHFNKFIGGHHG